MDLNSIFENLFGSAVAPAREREERRALDDLFRLTRQYSSTKNYHDLLQFIAKFRFYSPFNAMLVHVQMPGATYVAPPHRWLHDYHRRIMPGARPLVILQPRGPVMFVFDVSHTEPLEGAPPLPRKMTHPFEVRSGKVGDELESTIENAKRDGVRVSLRAAGSQDAGLIRVAQPGGFQDFTVRRVPKLQSIPLPIFYELLLNSDHSREARFATLAHELGHLFCGHIGSPDPKWWPDRRGLDHVVCEFEAESVCYLVCRRLQIDNPSEEYLSGYVKGNSETPSISLDSVLTTAGLIERMGRERMKPRKERDEG